MHTLRIATRQSPLAMWQARHVAATLEALDGGVRCELLPMRTQGDKLLDAPLAKVGGKGLFVKELETALLEDRADIAVHSMKDVPVTLPDGLHLPIIMTRADPRDALVSEEADSIDALPEGACVGTSSLRRQCQILARRPDLRVRTLRGAVDTRLAKLDAGEYDAILLACAGLDRLARGERIRQRLSPDVLLPAIGQGAMGIECRRDDAATERCVGVLHHRETAVRVGAERAMNARLEGGCQVPIAGHAVFEHGRVHLRGLVASVDGSTLLREEASAPPEDFERLGVAVAEGLLEQGAEAILQAVYADAR